MSSDSPASAPFQTNYADARADFLQAASTAGADITSIAHPLTGPDGEALFMDVACVGSDKANAAVVVTSGTHGIEGFCGSWIQTNLLQNAGDALAALGSVKLILVHAHNPHGFAWLRRVNEDNIDLNRNYVDFSEPQELNEEYLGVQELILPESFDDASEEALSRWIQKNGLDEYQRIVMGGQRVDPQGIFYGGTDVTWSHRTIQDVLPRVTSHQMLVGLLDVHTGLGPFGHGDLIHAYPKGSPEYNDLRAWFGDEMIGINAGEYGDVVAAVPRGPIVSSLDMIIPNKRSYGFVVEYGTLEFNRVLWALRADNWLHVHGDLSSARGREIKDEMRACFYSESDEWLSKIWARADWTLQRLANGLTNAGD